MARVERLPAVPSASLTTLSPLDGADRGVRIEVSGFNAGSDRDKEIRLNEVSPGYFQTFGIPVLQGRSFTAADSENAPKVALLNAAAAHFYFGNRTPLGGQVRFAQRDQFSPPYAIIGVIRYVRYENLRAPEWSCATRESG